MNDTKGTAPTRDTLATAFGTWRGRYYMSHLEVADVIIEMIDARCADTLATARAEIAAANTEYEEAHQRLRAIYDALTEVDPEWMQRGKRWHEMAIDEIATLAERARVAEAALQQEVKRSEENVEARAIAALVKAGWRHEVTTTLRRVEQMLTHDTRTTGGRADG